MPDAVFLDTNILVFATIREDPLHALATAAIARERAASTEIWISRQVLREFLATLTRPQAFPLPARTAVVSQAAYLAQAFHVAEDDGAVTDQLLDLALRVACGGKQIHDANIVATMLARRIPRLLTDNDRHFSRFATFIRVESLVPEAAKFTR